MLDPAETKKEKQIIQQKAESARRMAVDKAETLGVYFLRSASSNVFFLLTAKQQIDQACKTQKELIPGPAFAPCSKACPKYQVRRIFVASKLFFEFY